MLEKENQKKSFQLTILIILVSAFAIIGFFICNNLRSTNRWEAVLRKLNKEIEDKDKDIEEALVALEEIQSENIIITRMVAHDLKNPVGGIRNLLYSFINRQSVDEVKLKM